jgi:predicted ATP-grasp superfamily ATP-dependent carboligase
VPGVELTATAAEIDLANQYLDSGRYAEARDLLEELDSEDERAILFLGMSEYFLRDYAAAAEILEQLRVNHIDDGHVRMQAYWYEANALLGLDRAIQAAMLLAEVRAQRPGALFQTEAAAKYAEVVELLGLNNPGHDTDKR